jgi:hypothetical protein
MIRGMSYPKGIFYMNKEHIAHASAEPGGKIITHVFPFGAEGVAFFLKRVILSTPLYAVLGLVLISLWIWDQPGFPFYVFFLGLFGYHFVFPYPLKQYHGAEHKIFSHPGNKSINHLQDLADANIVNRHCSTNSVVTFYFVFILFFLPFGGNAAAFAGLLAVFLVPRWLKPIDEKLIFPISAHLQRKLTTIEPDMKHLKVALLSYLSLTRQQALTEDLLIQEMERAEERKRKEEQERRKKQEQQESLRIITDTEWREM